ncbi:hypothetical protein SAMN05216241_105132 [Limimonas halophila]|uniref:RiboL-PSP-HEPN domain-containing protein n=2 Tax=Limimonas halophila TaxID=1082479 RepID=A0A1G7RH81_9PROT|nr:hypothetical protein SAMN05216241_105132 [Limimonas halophila]
MYWASVSASEFADYKARHADQVSNAHDIFCVSGGNARRVPRDIDNWRASFSNFKKWLRLSCLVMAHSYFETYMRNIISLALYSDPGIHFNKPKLIDGINLVKYGGSLDVEDSVKRLVKGAWEDRIMNYEALFSRAPDKVKNNQEKLDELRKKRNRVAHHFGRMENVTDKLIDIESGSAEGISEENLKRALELFGALVADFDQQLMENHIGSFEDIWNFCEFKNEFWRRYGRTTIEPAEFKNELYRKTKIRPNISYCRHLIAYYESI